MSILHFEALATALILIPCLSVSKILRVTDGEYGALCDGVYDDTAALQKAFNAAGSQDIVQFPQGNCTYSKVLEVKSKENLIIEGAGQTGSVLTAQDFNHSAIYIFRCKNITLRYFRIDSPNSFTRYGEPSTSGVRIENSEDVTVKAITIWKTSSAGILIHNKCKSIRILRNQFLNTWADGVHVRDTSQVLIQYNYARETGDDSYASVGVIPNRNSDILILDNISEFSKASGVTIGGSESVKVLRNNIFRSTVAGVRIESNKGIYNVMGDNDVLIKDNVIRECPLNETRGHAPILVYSNFLGIHNVRLENNTIIQPFAKRAVRAFGTDTGFVNGLYIFNNSVAGNYTGLANQNCIDISGNVTRIFYKGNSYNGGPCNKWCRPKSNPDCNKCMKILK